MISGARKVKHGTPIHHKPSLCLSCRNATVVKGLAESEMIVYCSALPARYDILHHSVDQCSKYDDRRHPPPLAIMSKIAWPIVTDRSGKKIGFMSPQDYNKHVRDEHVRETGPLVDPLSGEEVW